MALDNLRGGTKRTVDEESLDNLRGGTKRTIQVNSIDNSKGGVKRVYVVGGGGGDQHNLGYYATQSALEEAHPTAKAGDWAIVGATDTVWIWDTDNSEWVDSDQKGQVTSVNGQTGDVTLTIPDAVQYSTMPTASANNLGDIIQFTGTTDANYTNGYFYKCVSDGQDPATYSWTQVNVQPSSGGSSYTAGNGISIDANNEISVADPVLVNKATGTAYAGKAGIGICDAGSTLTVLNGVGIGNGVLVETPNTSLKSRSVAIGNYARAAQSGDGGDVALGYNAWANGGMSIAIGHTAKTSALHAIQIGNASGSATNSDANTFKVANANGNFEIMSADGTIPAARHAALPTADGTYVLKLVIADGTPTLQWVAE